MDQFPKPLQSQQGIIHHKRPPAEAEPVFSNIKQNKGFKRFILKGYEKVEIEAGLLSIPHRNGRVKTSFFVCKPFRRGKNNNRYINSFDWGSHDKSVNQTK